MANATQDHGHGHGPASGEMDISEQKATFSNFIKLTEWGGSLVIMTVALLVFCFAMGLGWWTGVFAWLAVGALTGVLLRMKLGWWITVAASTIVLGVGGAIVLALMGAGG